MAINVSKLRGRRSPPPSDGNAAIERELASPTAPGGTAPAPAPSAAPAAPGERVLDGRALRRTGRTEQLNLKVRPDTKAHLLFLAQASGLGMAELVEMLIHEADVSRLRARRPATPTA